MSDSYTARQTRGTGAAGRGRALTIALWVLQVILAPLVRSLMREGLLDELRCVVCPVVRGKGRRLFEDEEDRRPLELVDSKTFGVGAVILTYRPAGEQGS